MGTVIWLLFGIVLVTPLLYFANTRSLEDSTKLLGKALMVAALIYVGFAAIWGDIYWLAIETLGIPIYGIFYWLSLRGSAFWLAVGWLLHPLWDVLLHLFGPGSHIAPEWYAIACISFDVAVSLYIFYRASTAGNIEGIFKLKS